MFTRRGRILTDLLAQVLVGENEDEILIFQVYEENYSKGSLLETNYTKI